MYWKLACKHISLSCAWDASVEAALRLLPKSHEFLILFMWSLRYLLWWCFRSLYLKSSLWRIWINYIIWFSLKSLLIEGILAWENNSTKSIEFLIIERNTRSFDCIATSQGCSLFLNEKRLCLFWGCLYPSLWKDTIHSETLRILPFSKLYLKAAG